MAAGAAIWMGFAYHAIRQRQREHVTWTRAVAASLEERGLKPRFDRHGVAWMDNGPWALLLDPPSSATASGRGGVDRVVLRAPPVDRLPEMTLRTTGAMTVVENLRLDDIQIGDQALDRQWTIDSSDPVAARLALGAGARDALKRLAPSTVDIDSQKLELSWRQVGTQVSTMLERIHLTEELLEGLQRGTWTDIGAALGLQSPTHRDLHGTLDGVVVAARASQNGTRVRAFRHSRLRAIHRSLPLEGAFPSQNPVLDQLIHVGGDPDLRDRLHDPALVEPLLEVVHGWPGSFVDAEGVTLVSEELLTDQLPKALKAALRLAKALP